MDRELETLRSKLADLSAHYTDRYPDVQNLKTQIANTEKLRDRLLADLKKSSSEPHSDKGAAAQDAEDPSTAPQCCNCRGRCRPTR